MRDSSFFVLLKLFLLLALVFPWSSPSNRAQEPANAKIEVTASLLDGQTVRGKLVSASSASCAIAVNQATKELAGNDVALLKFPASLDFNLLPIEVLLLDGSKACGSRLTGKASGWRLENGDSGEISIPSKSIRSARLKPIPTGLQAAWQAAIVEPAESDAVIVMRGNESLERINGIIVQVKENSVAFELDGEPIDIPLAKLIGLIWFQRPLERVLPTIEVVTKNHSAWMAESFQVADQKLELTTQLGQTVSLPLTTIVSINYSTANLRWLADVEPIEAVPEKRLDFKGSVASLERAMAPRFVVDRKAPTETASSSEKDLHFPGPGRFVFRVPEGFKTFQSQVVRTDKGSQRTDLTIEVWQDDQRLAEKALPYNVESIDLNVPVQSGKKTRITVGCASKLMIGTEVQWKQPRLKR